MPNKMDIQTLINAVITLCGVLGGWVLKVIWDVVKELQVADKILVEKVNTIEILIAGSYITKLDFEKLSGAIFLKLDRIMDKIDAKADK